MVSRLQFLRGDFSGRHVPFRPPWALPENAFTTHCTRCEACRDGCPTKLITKGQGGFPEVDFSRAECTFCGECAKACRDHALVAMESQAPWHFKAAIATTCFALRQVVCRSCGECCEAGAIRFKLQSGGVAEPQVNIDACTGCGACVRVCPANAVSMVTPVEQALAA